MCKKDSIRLAMAATLVAAATAWAGAPASSNREGELPRVCKGGPSAGEPCSADAECAPRPCVLASSGIKFRAVVTFVVDDNVGRFDGSEDVTDVVAVTALVEVTQGRRRRVVAQTYQNLAGDDVATLVANLQAGPFVADTGNSDRRVTESRLNDATAEDLFDDFLFQRGDEEMNDALRAFYGATGVPVVLKTYGLERFDEGGSGLASLVRLRVRGRFVTLL